MLGSGGGVAATLRGFDLFPKTLDEFKERTFVGATVSLVSIAAIIALVLGEVSYYRGIDRVDELYVDTRPEGLLDIHLNFTFPNLACDVLMLDVMDSFGETQLNVIHSIHKRRLDRQGNDLGQVEREARLGHATEAEVKQMKEALEKVKDPNYCGSCYGAEAAAHQCCNTCDEVREAYRLRGWALNTQIQTEQCVRERLERQMRASVEEGCNLWGSLQVNKVQGNFHFAPGKSFQQGGNHIHDFLPFELEHYNASHIIHSLGFGEQYPGIINPLDRRVKMLPDKSGLFQYFIKVVPTIFEHYGGHTVSTNQFSVTEFFKARDETTQGTMPGVFFIFEFSPIMVHIRELPRHRSLLHFLSNLCAIVGGVFTVAGLVGRVLGGGLQAARKLATGKVG
jgi:hypothetical protein